MRIFICLILITFSMFSLNGLCFAAQNEEITLTTYYPAPYGDYTDLYADNILSAKTAIGDVDGSGTIDSADLSADPSVSLTVAGHIRLKSDPVDNMDAATKQYVNAATGSKCYVSYINACAAGYTNVQTIGTWGICATYASAGGATIATYYSPPGGWCVNDGHGYAYTRHVVSTAVLCCT